jgi:membrane protein YfhO
MRALAMNPTWLYVGVVYAIAIWLARRAGADIPKRIAFFFYLLVLVFFWRPMTQDYINVEVDYYKTIPPWAYVERDHSVGNPQMNDVFFQLTPWAHQVRESWRSFDVPLWNGLSGGGYPLLANAQSQALSLIRIIALPLSLGHAMTAEGAMKILTALTFAFLFCGRRGYSDLASTIGAISCGFTMYIVVWLHFAHSTAACLVPAILYFVDLLAERITYFRFVSAAVIWCVMLFAGHPETAAHAFFLALMYVLWIAFIERPFADRRQALRFVGVLCGALAVAALLASPFLLPFAEALPKSQRYYELKNTEGGMPVPYTDVDSAIVLLQPHFFGMIPIEENWGSAEAESVTAFSGILGIAGFFALLAHVITTRAWRSREFFFVVATAIVFGVVFQWPGVSDAFHLIFHLAANARLRLLLGILFAIQAAAMIDLALRGRILPLLVGVLVASTLLLTVFFTYDFKFDYRRDSALLAMLPSIAVLAVSLLLTSARTRHAGMLALFVLVTAELWAVGRGWNPAIPGRMLYPPTPMISKMVGLKEKQPFRIVGYGAALFSNVPAIYGLEDMRSHDPMAHGRYMSFLAFLSASYDTSSYFAQWFDYKTRLLDFLNVKYMLIDPGMDLEDPQRWKLVYDGRDGRIFENTTVLPRFFAVRNVTLEFRLDRFFFLLKKHDDWAHTALLNKLDVESAQMQNDFLQPRADNAPEATSRIVSASNTDYRLQIDAPRYTLVASSLPWWPGWKVFRNGKRIDPIQINGAFLGFAAAPGHNEVRVVYQPWTFRVGVAVALATIVILIALSRLRERVARSAG